jgi:hypothetical protein
MIMRKSYPLMLRPESYRKTKMRVPKARFCVAKIELRLDCIREIRGNGVLSLPGGWRPDSGYDSITGTHN